MKKEGHISAFIAIALLCGALSASASTPCPKWMPKPYEQYLIKMQVERDTVPAPSVMLYGLRVKPKVDISHFKVGPFWVPDPPLLFEKEYEERDRDRYRKGNIAGAIIEDIINLFLL